MTSRDGRSTDAIVQMIENVDGNHEAAHKRLRGDFEELKREMTRGLSALREDIHTNKATIEAVKNTPLDATKLMLRTPVIVTIIAIVLGVAAGVWGIRSDMRDIITRMEAQKTAEDNRREFQNLQWTQLRADVDEIKRQQKLDQINNQDLKEKILTRK